MSIKRRSFIKTSSAIAVGLGTFRTGFSTMTEELAPTSKGRLPYKVIYNQDDSALFMKTPEPIQPEHDDNMVDEEAEAGNIWLQLNETLLGHAPEILKDTSGQKYYSWGKILDEPVLQFSAYRPMRSGTGETSWCSEMKEVN